MPKIVFVEPKAAEEHIFAQFKLPRLGVIILGTMMKERGWDINILIESLTPIELDELLDVDIVGISAITNTAGNAYALADELRLRGITVIMGGPHATFMPEEALDHADYVIRGEAENSFMDFIDAWEGKKGFWEVPGLSFRKDGTILHNSATAAETALDDLPIADLSLVKNSGSMRVLPIQTSRGCPYDCSFCSVTGMFGRHFRFRSTEHILRELRGYRNMGKMIFFYDDHFAANRTRAKELLRAMIQEGLKFKWSTQVRVEVARDGELLELMKRAGCHTLFIGLESANPESLFEMKKNQTIDDIINAVKVIQSYGIHVHGMFVYGFDSDSMRIVKETVRFARDLDLTSVQFLILTPYPGTRFYAEVKDRIVSRDWSLYDAHHVVFRPKHFSMKALQYAQVKSHNGFYSWGRIIKLAAAKRWVAMGIALYSHALNFLYVMKNMRYFTWLISQDRAVSENEVSYPEEKAV
jgi:radical SAM superfamily enzyme YgiQ (UPF0313 family)